MKPWSSKIWQDIEDVEVTDEDINTAIRVMSVQGAFENKMMLFQTVMLSATVIAYLRALKDRNADRGLLARLVCDELPVETMRLMIEVHGLIDPFDNNYERQVLAQRQDKVERAERAAASKARRELKRAAEIEAEVQKRLAMAA
jgi:hypothetical protein